jgi:hypothetical protein
MKGSWQMANKALQATLSTKTVAAHLSFVVCRII